MIYKMNVYCRNHTASIVVKMYFLSSPLMYNIDYKYKIKTYSYFKSNVFCCI